VCSLARDSGTCDDWYLEPVRRQCRRFLYGGDAALCHITSSTCSQCAVQETGGACVGWRETQVRVMTTAPSATWSCQCRRCHGNATEADCQALCISDDVTGDDDVIAAVTWSVTWSDNDRHGRQAEDSVQIKITSDTLLGWGPG